MSLGIIDALQPVCSTEKDRSTDLAGGGTVRRKGRGDGLEEDHVGPQGAGGKGRRVDVVSEPMVVPLDHPTYNTKPRISTRRSRTAGRGAVPHSLISIREPVLPSLTSLILNRARRSSWATRDAGVSKCRPGGWWRALQSKRGFFWFWWVEVVEVVGESGKRSRRKAMVSLSPFDQASALPWSNASNVLPTFSAHPSPAFSGEAKSSVDQPRRSQSPDENWTMDGARKDGEEKWIERACRSGTRMWLMRGT